MKTTPTWHQIQARRRLVVVCIDRIAVYVRLLEAEDREILSKRCPCPASRLFLIVRFSVLKFTI